MAKDPAFLFYSQDFFTGTASMTFEDKGKYIHLLCLMHQQGRMDEKTISFLVGSISVNLKNKFRIDKHGLWYNERLEEESEKRKKFTESRRNNGKLGGRPKKKRKANAKPTDNRMEDENEDENTSVSINENSAIIAFLNEKTGKNFRSTNKETTAKLSARKNEGYKFEDFKTVIIRKCADWLNTEDDKWLRPQTLFGTKFESYLNQKPATNGKPDVYTAAELQRAKAKKKGLM